MTENRTPVIGGFYRHFKNRLYQVLHLAVHANTEEELVVYQALYGDFRVYVRPLLEFMSEVDHEKYPEVRQKYRFEQVTLSGETRRQEAFRKIEITRPETAPKVQEDEGLGSVDPMLLKFLDAETCEERLKIFDAMEDTADMHILDAIAASMDLSLSGNATVAEGISLIRDNLATQQKYECSRWR